MLETIIFFTELFLSTIGILIIFVNYLGGKIRIKRLILPLFVLSTLIVFYFYCDKKTITLLQIVIYLFVLISITFAITNIKRTRQIYIIILYHALSLALISLLILISRNIINNYYVNYFWDVIVNVILLGCLIIPTKKNKCELINNYFSFASKYIKIYPIVLLYCLSFTAMIITYLPERKTFNIWYLLSLVFAAMLIVAIILLPLLISNNISKNYLKRINKIEDEQLQSQTRYYKKLLEKNTELRRFKHDYKNQLIVLQSYLEKNNIDSAKEYIRNSSKFINSLEEYNTGNYVLDALLDEKIQKAYQYNTIIRYSGHLVQYSLDDIDLCIIFGNAIDNAIEACEKIQTTESKIISIIIKQQNHILKILITNPVSEPPIIENNMIVTSKIDKGNHGLGLYSIKRTIKKYNGLCEISCKDNIFSINITLSI